MKKIIILFLTLNCLLSFGQESAVSNKKSKFSLNINSGFTIGDNVGLFSFGEILYFKYKLPFDINLNYAHKGKKRWHEFGVAYIQKSGVTNSNSGNVNCNSQVFLVNVSFMAKFNYLAFHYGIEFPLKNELFSITPFLRIGHSFNSNYEKIVDPYCFQIYSDLSYREKTPYLETGFGLNYKVVQKNHLNMALRLRSSFRGIQPREDIYFSLGLVMEFGN
jgi:hypothetical protein